MTATVHEIPHRDAPWRVCTLGLENIIFAIESKQNAYCTTVLILTLSFGRGNLAPTGMELFFRINQCKKLAGFKTDDLIAV